MVLSRRSRVGRGAAAFRGRRDIRLASCLDGADRVGAHLHDQILVTAHQIFTDVTRDPHPRVDAAGRRQGRDAAGQPPANAGGDERPAQVGRGG